ncbi:hypothetical protein KJ975_08925 [Myxococcota bacterium]|nr:hypothetical protein [Myxococcota bacterium]
MKKILILSLVLAGLAVACHTEQPYVTTPSPRNEVQNDQGPTPTPGYYPADGPTDEPEKKKGYYGEDEGY